MDYTNIEINEDFNLNLSEFCSNFNNIYSYDDLNQNKSHNKLHIFTPK